MLHQLNRIERRECIAAAFARTEHAKLIGAKHLDGMIIDESSLEYWRMQRISLAAEVAVAKELYLPVQTGIFQIGQPDIVSANFRIDVKSSHDHYPKPILFVNQNQLHEDWSYVHCSGNANGLISVNGWLTGEEVRKCPLIPCKAFKGGYGNGYAYQCENFRPIETLIEEIQNEIVF